MFGFGAYTLSMSILDAWHELIKYGLILSSTSLYRLKSMRTSTAALCLTTEIGFSFLFLSFPKLLLLQINIISFDVQCIENFKWMLDLEMCGMVWCGVVWCCSMHWAQYSICGRYKRWFLLFYIFVHKIHSSVWGNACVRLATPFELLVLFSIYLYFYTKGSR